MLRTVFLSRIGEAQERVRPGGRLGSALEPPATGGSSVVDVIGKDTTGRRWSIGDLAHASGLTVRALYHYDEIGLLSASERTASGHRRYTEGDLRRLYRIRALRALGLSLEQIAGVLEDSSSDDLLSLRDLLADQLRNLQEQAEHIDRLRNRIHGLVRQLDESSMPDPDQFMTTLEMISVYETGFTREQREQLAERRAELGPDAVEAAKSRWAELVEQLLGHVRDNTPVDDPQVQDLVRRWDELGATFHAVGEQGERTKAAARRMWQDNSAELGRSLPWPADRMTALVGYLERARQAR
ncbi:MerR family transcriptional regulator [Streptomyces sp. NBC_01707]|uniref:MerR family transcriptional regulator n=1 Tax=unclassified Streptomyces TaxID=2593676 RepID=UPI0029AA7EC7|nr:MULTISPECIES: MerR family transcriptional regulator [unclassified Streptomyces]MDX2730307.1 MerR family transcriptional regulator [Streptomyces sp. PA03-2a]MDX3768992.1 MerR family transcriptional regulator [Streptomyces sp. AK08-01B]MDX3815604.1 MerR family transcriptional regulator [Streptomyces sp. AK08-01A]